MFNWIILLFLYFLFMWLFRIVFIFIILKGIQKIKANTIKELKEFQKNGQKKTKEE